MLWSMSPHCRRKIVQWFAPSLSLSLSYSDTSSCLDTQFPWRDEFFWKRRRENLYLRSFFFFSWVVQLSSVRTNDHFFLVVVHLFHTTHHYTIISYYLIGVHIFVCFFVFCFFGWLGFCFRYCICLFLKMKQYNNKSWERKWFLSFLGAVGLSALCDRNSELCSFLGSSFSY